MVGFTTQLAEIEQNLEGQIADLSFQAVGVAAILVVLLVVIASQIRDRFPKLKAPVYGLIAAIVGSTTFFLLGSTIYLNVVSDSGGPVHRHADIEYWACGAEVELRDPYKFLSNKIGTATLHEHNDKRIHLEGVVVDEDVDATLGNFMRIIGGDLTKGSISIPVHQERLLEDDVDGDQVNTEYLAYLESKVRGTENSRLLDLRNGDTCGEGLAAVPGELQVFVYTFNEEDDTYAQSKLEDPESYIYSSYSNVPPGDCIIFEFDRPKDFTDKLCMQYGLKDSQRCTEFGVEEYDPDFCDITDVTDYSSSSVQGEVQLERAGEEDLL